MRQIVLDTETTGLEPAQGHRIIEIGCVELVNRRPTNNYFHHYLQPDREIDEGAVQVHGITNEFLKDKPRFTDVVEAFLDFIRGAELIIHNAAFDVGFINHELKLAGRSETVEQLCRVIDTLAMARTMHPGQRNSLDALCKRYNIDNSQRELHGALLDARILADVYLAMTGGQVTLSLDAVEVDQGGGETGIGGPRRGRADRPRLKGLEASAEERAAHEDWLAKLDKAVGGPCLWRRLEQPAEEGQAHG